FSYKDQLLKPVLECGIKENSMKKFPCTVRNWESPNPTDDKDNKNEIEWRIDDPLNIEIFSLLFIPVTSSITAARVERERKLKI
ncbi:unnamed protein product, partial [Didymodactylos carnosus]